MKKYKKNLSKLSFVLIFFLAAFGFFSKRLFQHEQGKDSSFPESGLVTAIYDGDTIKVKFKNEKERSD